MKKNRPQTKTRGRRLRGAASAALLGASAFLVDSASAAKTAATKNSLEARVIIVRDSLVLKLEDAPKDSASGLPKLPYGEWKLAQWANWGNWGNWNNWRDWNNWNDWHNWSDWSNWGKFSNM